MEIKWEINWDLSGAVNFDAEAEKWSIMEYFVFQNAVSWSLKLIHFS